MVRTLQWIHGHKREEIMRKMPKEFTAPTRRSISLAEEHDPDLLG